MTTWPIFVTGINIIDSFLVLKFILLASDTGKHFWNSYKELIIWIINTSPREDWALEKSDHNVSMYMIYGMWFLHH